MILSVLSVLPVFPVHSVHAQGIRAEGRVVRDDSTGVPGARVVLHRIGREVQGPLDSGSSDRRGRFSFRFTPDTSALYLLSARHAGIEYFSPPLHTSPERPDTAIRIIVYDTSSTVPVRLTARHLVISRPGEDRTRGVLDLIVLENQEGLTRVASDSLHPSWSGPLLPGTMGLELGEGDFSPDAVTRRNDSLILTAPVAPGEKQVTVQYLIPAQRTVLELPFSDSVSAVNVLTEEKGARLSGGTLVAADTQIVQGRWFRRWSGNVPAGAVVRIDLPGAPREPRWLLAALVAPVAAVLAFVAWHTLRRPPTRVLVEPSEHLLEAIARLDDRYLGRETEVSASEWSAYQNERARLKAQLQAALAAEGLN